MKAAVVGGGAAGFFLAINLKEMCPQMDVTILEASHHVLAKVKISGGGRCNCTNSFEEVRDLQSVYPRGHRLLKRLFKQFDHRDAYEWFDSQTIINLFLNETRRLGVTIQTGSRINSLDELSDYDFIAITTGGIRQRLREFSDSLRRDFGIERPRIAVLSLNPHAGENGLLGSEEQQVIRPAIDQAYDEDRIVCFGPYAADGFFGNRQYRNFDGVLAMYHDQGLAPFKALAMDSGVNFTAGLPFVRTSPDHGTGYDIAGKGVAREDSMRQAIYMAIDIWRNRQRYDEAGANPLRKQYHDKGKDNVVLDLTKETEE